MIIIVRTFAKDAVGTTIKNFYILDWKRENNRTYYYIQCKLCGNKKWMRKDAVTNTKVLSCGCYNRDVNYYAKHNLLNKRFGRLIVISETDFRAYNGAIIWKCMCDCGNEKLVNTRDLEAGRVKSCGCLGKENSKRNMAKAMAKRNKTRIFDTDLTVITSTKPRPSNVSGVRGIQWDKQRSKWVPTIQFQNKRYYLGRYSDFNEAVKVRKEAEKKIFGEFLDWYNKMFCSQK